MTEYDLFECGDDVTFGSRSTYLMTSVHGSRPIRIEPGATSPTAACWRRAWS